jgi:hypothetical protein
MIKVKHIKYWICVFKFPGGLALYIFSQKKMKKKQDTKWLWNIKKPTQNIMYLSEKTRRIMFSKQFNKVKSWALYRDVHFLIYCRHFLIGWTLQNLWNDKNKKTGIQIYEGWDAQVNVKSSSCSISYLLKIRRPRFSYRMCVCGRTKANAFTADRKQEIRDTNY